MQKFLTVLVLMAIFLSVMYALFIYTPKPEPAKMVVAADYVVMLYDSVASFNIANSGQSLLKWQLEYDVPWLEVYPQFGWLGSVDLDSVKITVNRTGLADGIHRGKIGIRSNGGNDSVWVELYVNKNLKLEVAPDSFKFAGNPGDVLYDKLAIYNAVAGLLKYEANVTADWIGLSHYAGIAPDTLKLTVSTEALKVGNYQTEIRIAASDQVKTIPVYLSLTEKPGGYQYFRFDVETVCALNPGWKLVEIDRKKGFEAIVSSVPAPKAEYRLDFKFYTTKPETVYVFGEVFVDNSDKSDSFWFGFNDKNYQWKNLNSFLDYSWGRAWAPFNRRFGFVTVAGENVVSLYPRGLGADINWIVVTNDPALDIDKFVF